MTKLAKSLDIFETCCYPKGCCIDREQQILLAFVHVPQLQQSGLTTTEYTRGALLLEEPSFSKVKAVVCRGCNHVECIHNKRAGADNILGEMLNCGYAERRERNAELADVLLPKQKLEEWASKGVVVTQWVTSSRKNVGLSIDITVDEKRTNLTVRYQKDKEKVIFVWTDPMVKYPLPTSTNDIVTLLHQIIESFVPKT